jgi:LPS O-antigen subunit length determinant protein (WzzB/FepE family)
MKDRVKSMKSHCITELERVNSTDIYLYDITLHLTTPFQKIRPEKTVIVLMGTA